MRVPRAQVLAALVSGVLPTTGCFTGDDGLTPPLRSFYFPTGLAISSSGQALYVANSDFDLQYNGGTVQALDLATLRDGLVGLRNALNESGACTFRGTSLGANPNPVLNPGPCAPIDAEPFVVSFATIGAFASGAVFASHPDGSQSRLFVPVRGDPSITYFDVCQAPGCVDLFCEGSGDEHRCGLAHRIGEDRSTSTRGLTLPVEPVGIAASDDGRVLVVAHQTTNQASLILNRWHDDPPGTPNLEFTLSQLPEEPTEVASIPTPELVRTCRPSNGSAPAGCPAVFDYRPSFLLTYRSSAEIDVIRFNDDAGSNEPRPFITRVFAAGITVNASGHDSRGIAVDASARQACEASCGKDATCLLGCLDTPIRVYVANRAPPSLLVGEVETTLAETEGVVTGAFDTVRIFDTVPIAIGASKVALGNVIDPHGNPQLRVFAVAFDSRRVFVYDPAARRVEAIITTGRGPHAIAFTTAPDTTTDPSTTFSFLLVGHFTDSYIGVVDLDMRNRTFGEMFATVGHPVPPADAN